NMSHSATRYGHGSPVLSSVARGTSVPPCSFCCWFALSRSRRLHRLANENRHLICGRGIPLHAFPVPKQIPCVSSRGEIAGGTCLRPPLTGFGVVLLYSLPIGV